MTRLLVTLGVVGVLGCGADEQPQQPLPFSHAIHAGAEAIACTDCHAGAETEAGAGLPALGTCMRCHMRPRGQQPNPREQTLRTLAAQGGPFRWVQVTRNEGHVYFSHRAHVAFAKMTCEGCHGDVRTWAASPTQPNADLLSMSACMDCHRERGASNECLTCHR